MGASRKIAALADTVWKWVERGWKVAPVVLTVVAAIGTGWAATVSGWLDAYGPVAWVLASLVGGLFFAAIWWVAAAGIERYARSQWIRASRRPAEGINPLNSVFTNQRIDINVFKSPLPSAPVGPKTFVDCQLIGPAVVFFQGHATITGANINSCDFVVVEENRQVHNVTVFQDLTIRGGSVYFLTVLVPAGAVASIPDGANWITRK